MLWDQPDTICLLKMIFFSVNCDKITKKISAIIILCFINSAVAAVIWYNHSSVFITDGSVEIEFGEIENVCVEI